MLASAKISMLWVRGREASSSMIILAAALWANAAIVCTGAGAFECCCGTSSTPTMVTIVSVPVIGACEDSSSSVSGCSASGGMGESLSESLGDALRFGRSAYSS